jgi:hypothetical protein
MEVLIAYAIGSIVTLWLTWRHFSAKAIVGTIDYLCNDGYLAYSLDKDGDIEIVKLEEVINDTIKTIRSADATNKLPKTEI